MTNHFEVRHKGYDIIPTIVVDRRNSVERWNIEKDGIAKGFTKTLDEAISYIENIIKEDELWDKYKGSEDESLREATPRGDC